MPKGYTDPLHEERAAHGLAEIAEELAARDEDNGQDCEEESS